jgi:hypothetical protein
MRTLADALEICYANPANAPADQKKLVQKTAMNIRLALE